MTVERFNLLTLPQQWYYTKKCGVYLASVNDEHCSVDLFQCERFYVERFYKPGETECWFVKAFTGTFFLNKYLEQISIEQLFET